MRHITLIIAVLALAIAAPAIAGKGGNGNGGGGGNTGGGSGSGGGSRSYSGWLTATPSTLHAGDSFTVSGCGYDDEYGNVVVGFTGGSWGSSLTGGCFSIAGIPALSGDTLPAGTYPVTAYQYVHGKWTATGSTTVTVVN
jgi:hypothetical protein